jgi:hypothetical protein
MREVRVLVGQLLSLQESSAVGWMTWESSINFWQGKVFCHLESIQTTSEASLAPHSVHTQGKVAGPGRGPHISF